MLTGKLRQKSCLLFQNCHFVECIFNFNTTIVIDPQNLCGLRFMFNFDDSTLPNVLIMIADFLLWPHDWTAGSDDGSLRENLRT